MGYAIATAPRKTTKVWKNEVMTWPKLTEKLTNPIITNETVAQYKAMSKDERDRCKDQGGFVGGYLENGQRKRGTVKYRSLITLDADNCKAADNFDATAKKALKDIQAVMYTTHSHTPEKPRWRIVIALANTVTPEMYEPLARKLAEKIGIDFFDPTTYEASRLMYWPSACRDGEFLPEVIDGEPLDADDILAEYEDWRDASAWPTGSTEAQVHAKELKKLGDPREKNGIIGAFCRAYSIEEAIAAFLPDVYIPCDVPNRYTYAGGSTTGGVIIYDDGLHAFSHHATDPISGQDVNAFDLVRLNMFGARDEDAKEDTPVAKLPSYVAMTEWAAKQEKVKQEQSAALFGSDADALLASEDENWKTQFLLDNKGKILKRVENFLLILFNDTKLKDAFGLDDFSHRLMVKRDLPWRKQELSAVWRDADDAQLRNYISKHYHGLASPNLLNDAFEEVANKNRFNQVKDWLDSLKHDGEKRAERILVDYLGAEDCAYTREITRLFLKAAVARIYRPGAKFDQCLVLTGPQGIGKSTVLNKLGSKWFNDTVTCFGGKDVLEQLQGSWIIELGEMQAANRAENDQIKSFISRQVDKFRAPYGRRTEEYPRQCVFAATTNDDIFLKDRTGGRRFWIVPCAGGNIDKLDDLTPEFIAQVWAEVRNMYRSGSSLRLSKESTDAARALQKEKTEGAELEGMIAEFANKLLPENWEKLGIEERRHWLRHDGDATEIAGTVQRDKICALEIWCELLGGSIERVQNFKLREINAILQNLPGWSRPKNKIGTMRFGKIYGIQRCFIRDMSSRGRQNNVNEHEKDVNELDIL